MIFSDADPRWTSQALSESVRKQSRWMEAMGFLLVLFGIFALSSVVDASIASAFLIGALLLASGVTQIVATIAYWFTRRGGFNLGVILGSLCAISGILCLTNPARTLEVLTFILAIYFIASGVVRLTMSVGERLPGWGWGVVASVVDVLLGIVILAAWPAASLVVLGTILGIQLISSGINAIATGMAVRKLIVPRAEPSHGRPATRFQH